MTKILMSLVLALALVGAVDARPSSSSSSGSRSSSSSSSSRGISLAKPSAPAAKPGINLTKPAAAPSSGGINLTKLNTNNTTVTNTAKPSRCWFGCGNKTQTQSQTSNSIGSRPTTVTVVHEHHYFGHYGYSGPGYYGGYSGGFGSSPFFWLWLLDRPHQSQPVIVAGQPSTGGASASFATPVPEASGTEKFFNVLLGVLLIAAILAGFTWLLIKVSRK